MIKEGEESVLMEEGEEGEGVRTCVRGVGGWRGEGEVRGCVRVWEGWVHC